MSSSETSSAAAEPATSEAKDGPPIRALLIGAAIALVVVLIGVISLLVGGGSSTSSTTSSSVHVGSPVPSFTLQALGGNGTVSVPADGGGHGRPAVLLFFASWCTDCQREMPALAKAIRQGDAKGAAVIGIDGQDEPTAAAAFVAKNGMDFPIGTDPDYAVTSGKFGFVGLPETVYVSAKGIITRIDYGATSPAALRSGVATITG